jgi:hypothetical protein
MTEALAEAARSNGHATMTNEDTLIFEQMKARRDELAAKRDELQAEIDRLTPDLKRYEKAMLALAGEPVNGAGRKRTDTPEQAKPKYAKSLSDERLDVVRQAVFAIARHSDDFTQVEVRANTGLNSSTTATGFELLRQEGTIRFVRADGLKKIFRLTREGMRAAGLAESDSDDA